MGFLKGNTPWNKGKKAPQLSRALKGRKSWNKGLNKNIDIRVAKYAQEITGRIRPEMVGEKNPSRRPDVIEKLRQLNLGRKNPQYGKKLTTEHKRKLLEGFEKARKDVEKNRLWNARVSMAMKGKPKSEDQIKKMRAITLSRDIRFPQKDTSIEVKLRSELSKKNLLNHFKENIAIKNICRPDLVSHKFKLAVFCDGDFWHVNPRFYNGKILTKVQEANLKRDRRQNDLLQKSGWKVLRFWESDIKENASRCVDEINEIITNGEKYDRN